MSRDDHGKFSANDLNGRELLWTGSPNVIVHYLARPADEPSLQDPSNVEPAEPFRASLTTSAKAGPWLATVNDINGVLAFLAKSRPQKTTFEDIPYDIYDGVFRELPLEDAVCLAMSSRYLWNCRKHLISKQVAYFAQSWAGSRLSLAQVPNIPPAGRSIGDDVPSIAVRHPKTDNIFASMDELSAQPPKILNEPKRRLKLTKNEWWPKNTVWVLRNRSKRQIIYADKIALRPDFVKGPFIATPGFGDLLLFQTQFAGFTTAKEGPGTWAGDKFDIVTIDIHRKEMKECGKKWMDVSLPVLEDWGSRQKKIGTMDWKQRCIRLHEMKMASNPNYLLTEAGIIV